MKNVKNSLQILLIILIIATIAFIFTNSIMPPDVSSEQSNTVAGILERIIPTDTPFGAFIQKYVRKLAHFCEYGLLGFEIAIYVMLYAESKLKSAALNMLTPFAVGFIDEGIQIFSGRGPALTDVLIDASGFITLSIITYAFCILIGALRSKKRRRKNG